MLLEIWTILGTPSLKILISCLCLFLWKEFETSFFQMDSNKSPSLDGLNPAFYKTIWHLCGPDIFSATTDWLEHGTLTPEVTFTTIFLISKCNNLSSMKDFRPIALCNVLYKIISKAWQTNSSPSSHISFPKNKQRLFKEDQLLIMFLYSLKLFTIWDVKQKT